MVKNKENPHPNFLHTKYRSNLKHTAQPCGGIYSLLDRPIVLLKWQFKVCVHGLTVDKL